jgi:hypothetical protein
MVIVKPEECRCLYLYIFSPLAIIDLNGRYFGGRTVKAGFYNLDKFRRYDLMDELELK